MTVNIYKDDYFPKLSDKQKYHTVPGRASNNYKIF